jgi:hypothetical protein
MCVIGCVTMRWDLFLHWATGICSRDEVPWAQVWAAQPKLAALSSEQEYILL